MACAAMILEVQLQNYSRCDFVVTCLHVEHVLNLMACVSGAVAEPLCRSRPHQLHFARPQLGAVVVCRHVMMLSHHWP
eukprot:715161-Amphidinium_carterae.1